MKVLIEKTGGLCVQAESFGHSVFKDSFKRVFQKAEESLGLAHNDTLEINCSKDIKIQGIIGPRTSLEKKGPTIASTVIGQGNTTAWKLCGLDKDTCLTVFFDISSSEKSDASGDDMSAYNSAYNSTYSSPTRLSYTENTRKNPSFKPDIERGNYDATLSSATDIEIRGRVEDVSNDDGTTSSSVHLSNIENLIGSNLTGEPMIQMREQEKVNSVNDGTDI